MPAWASHSVKQPTDGRSAERSFGGAKDRFAARLPCTKCVRDFRSGARACGTKGRFGAAGLIKQLTGQLNVVIHALGILLCLPHILRPGEVIDYVSLGAGNTNRNFDLETNQRIAEFKFIHWQGGSESIRQNSLFKDFYVMAEHETTKEKFLYVVGTEQGEKFFNGRRAMSSILSHHVRLKKQFTDKFGDQYRTVRDYYLPRKGLVVIQDVSPFVPELVAAAVEAAEAEEE